MLNFVNFLCIYWNDPLFFLIQFVEMVKSHLIVCISTHLVFEYGIKFAFLKLSPFNSDVVSFSCIAALNLLMFCWYYLHLCSQNVLFCRLIFLLYLFMIFVILATKSWELLQLMTFPKRLHRTSIILCSLNSVKNNHWLYLGLIYVCVFVFF